MSDTWLSDASLAESPFPSEVDATSTEVEILPPSWPGHELYHEAMEDNGGLFESPFGHAQAEPETPDVSTGGGRLALPAGSTSPDVVLQWNAMAKPTRIDIVVHFHGDNTTARKLHVVNDVLPISGLDFTDPDNPAVAGRRRPTLTILPGGKFVGGSKFRFPTLVAPGGLDKFIDDCLREFSSTTGIAAKRGRLILTAHSGGGYTIEQILASNDPDEIHYFDAFYPPPNNLVQWIRRHVDRDRNTSAPFQRSGAFRAIQHDPDNKAHMQRAQAALCRALAGDSGLGGRYRIESTSTKHCAIPRRYGWRLLAESDASLPGTTLVTCRSSRRSTEAESDSLWASEAAPEFLDEDDSWDSEAAPEFLDEDDSELFTDPEFASEFESLDEPANAFEAEELFEAEEFARHALYEAITDEDADLGEDGGGQELEAVPAGSRPPIRRTSQLRTAWRDYECAQPKMRTLRLFGWNTPVNPETVDAWRALEHALVAAGYQAHRAWVYNCRDIGGQQTRSLHAYGLAIDIDHARPTCNVNRATPDGRAVRFSSAATKEDRCRDVRQGRADTSFTPAQVAAVEAIRTVDGHQVFAWGGRWRSTKDTMHFQINVTPAELARGIRTEPDSSAAELEAFEDEAAAVEYQAGGSAEPSGNIAVSTGEFGKALKAYARLTGVPDSVIRLLKQSTTYKSIVKVLDEKYIAGVVGSEVNKFQNGDGVFTAGTHQGRRRVYVLESLHGSQFSPFGSPDNYLAGDIIFIERPDGTGDPTQQVSLQAKGQWLESIAHESIHAARLVQGRRRAGATPTARITAGIDDEIATRKMERQIVDELRGKFKEFAKFQPTTGSFERSSVERDFFPGEQRRTYLEHFVLAELLNSGRQQLSQSQIAAYQELVPKISLGAPPFKGFLTAMPQFTDPRRGRTALFRLMYPNILLALRVVDARWRSVSNLDPQDDADDATLENVRLEHAKAFFAGLASYTRRPPKAPGSAQPRP
ncbi:D-alanyl-D-alanine carboxypeptidase-like protein [Micromonospora kangleipakensis]|uniref:D-alanyl-D-alanine carboxypeptidase-like protein n=1 Tax=Micromonospora kangleipakensis TaxID=1077942 RepID=A0A4Q8BFH7_9ACTN|nr:M15 family metallopeptidase [Micromonospora kangleipakensis]RZU76727.1 D-alanyl-D-alanine carboxypeptidase-like protein [Micromonospora kangleipakensis]